MWIVVFLVGLSLISIAAYFLLTYAFYWGDKKGPPKR